MKLMPYKEALKLGESKIAELLIPLRVTRAKMQAELEKCKLEEKIATIEASLHKRCGEERVDFASIIEMQDEMGLLERRRSQYQKIIEQMFPDD